MDRQEVFNTVVRGLRAQGWERSMGPGHYGPTCKYRGDDGRKCAIGHLIPDDKYDPTMEGLSPYNSRMRDPLTSLNLIEHVNMLADLQTLHDMATSPEDMEQNFRHYAEHCDLNWPED